MDYIFELQTGHINFSPVGFRLAAADFLRCYDAFKPRKFSVVPFFLCCRAIELGLKAIHLETLTQAEVKRDFGHDLKAAYDALPVEKRTLSQQEAELLARANTLYRDKSFEYVQPIDAAGAYRRFPDLNALAQLARKIVPDEA